MKPISLENFEFSGHESAKLGDLHALDDHDREQLLMSGVDA